VADGIELSGIGVPEAGEGLSEGAEELALFSSSIFKISKNKTCFIFFAPFLSRYLFPTPFPPFTNLHYLELG